ncbi:MAG: hypothetical protein LBD13_01875 [Spirochaetaceae bacterium]|jgi:hypothetical protein|nr:hypothetical protein [Spirochaetaceae bacterium]
MKHFFIASLAALAALSCENLDVVGKDSAASFDKVLQAMSRNVAEDQMNGGWSLNAPDNSARFIWSKDFSQSPMHDVMIELDAAPFLQAGLDPDKLPQDYAFYGGKLMVGTKLGEEKLTYKGEPTPLLSYQKIVELKRGALGYHGALDHYGINLGNGNLFEWAKDMAANDKDMVFVLNPEPFIAAGVDPNSLAGWLFGKVTVDGENGNPLEVEKLLKPFDLPAPAGQA